METSTKLSPLEFGRIVSAFDEIEMYLVTSRKKLVSKSSGRGRKGVQRGDGGWREREGGREAVDLQHVVNIYTAIKWQFVKACAALPRQCNKVIKHTYDYNPQLGVFNVMHQSTPSIIVPPLSLSVSFSL